MPLSYIKIDLPSFIPIYYVLSCIIYCIFLIFIFISRTDPVYASYAIVLIQIEISSIKKISVKNVRRRESHV